MPNYDLVPGDTILANNDIFNDGSFPESPDNSLLVKSGTRGVIINHGHLEHNESRQVFLVKFEQGDKTDELGPPIGCWPEDIRPIIEE
jgi:nitrogen fixation protein NifZ